MVFDRIKIGGLLLIGLILSFRISAQSNEGTRFWFAFLQHRDQNNSKKCIITSKSNTTGTIEIPSINWRRNFSVNANSVFIADIPDESELIGSERITQQAVLVTTEKPSSVYIHQYFTFRADAALVLPLESLGNNYYIMTYRGYQNIDGHYPSEFLIVGTEDGTTVQLNYSCNTAGGKKKGEKHSIALNRGETIQIQAATVSDDLTGSLVQANKSIAVFSGNRWTQIPNGNGNRDNLLEQMYPVEVWGKQFVAVPTKFTTVDRYRILASDDNTSIQFYGNNVPGNLLLNKGQWKEFELRANPALIQSSKPIMVAQFLVGGNSIGLNGLGDPSMVLLNSVEQMRDTVTIYNSPFENIERQFINLICLTKDTGNLRIDGKGILQSGNQFQFIGLKNEYAFSQLSVNQGPHIISSGGCGVIAIAYGYGSAESYAYGGGANFYKFNNLPITDGTCLGDSLEFNSGLPSSRFKVSWELGDGKIFNSHSFKYSYDKLGSYRVKLIIHDVCNNKVDSSEKLIQITLRENLIAYPDTLICEGSDVQLMAFDKSGSQYNWSGPNNFHSDQQNPTLSSVTKNHEGQYTVVGTYAGCATYPRNIEILISENPKPNLGQDTFFCPALEPIEISTKTNDKIIWDDGTFNETRPIDREGLYFVKLINENNCTGVDSIRILEKCPFSVFVPNVFSPNGDGINDYFVTSGMYIESFRMEIYTRWGEKMFFTTDQSIGWNGHSANGKLALPGTYIYFITVEGYNSNGQFVKQNFHGDVTLVR